MAIGGWDETNGTGGYDVTPQNMMPLIRDLREHGWEHPRAIGSRPVHENRAYEHVGAYSGDALDEPGQAAR